MSDKQVQKSQAMFGAGCFWGVEQTFRLLKGVIKTAVGFSGGHVKDVTYNEVCSGKSGHAEVVYLEFDPKIISYENLVNIFWKCHDPTQIDRQGPDHGTQYRSVIFYYNDEQMDIAQKSKKEINDSKTFKGKIATEISPAKKLYLAEDYHQQYADKNPWRPCHVYIATGFLKDK